MSDAVIVESLTDIDVDQGRAVILFTAPSWCVPCVRFKPHWERAVANTNDVNFFYVDIDAVPDAMVEYSIRSVPTVKLYENGTFVRDVKAPQAALPFISDISE